jgi:deoxyhypusine synthase
MKQPKPTGTVSGFIDEHFQHFNAARVKEAADGYRDLLAKGGKMFLSLAGAMSTAELGKSLAPLIRAHKLHGICCTGANLEEDLFNLVARQKYEQIPDYMNLSPEDELKLFERHINRVTDTGIPEKAAMTPIEKAVKDRWHALEKSGERCFPHEVLYDIIMSRELAKHFTGEMADSWLVAAATVDLPLYVPGWEDSTLGNVFAAECLEGTYQPSIMQNGIEYMMALAEWYRKTSAQSAIGFFQIGGGIAGDFSICVVPLLQQDLGEEKTKLWQYFCQITDAEQSFGGYSGALPNEKITWGKIGPDTPSFVIKSDATIAFPLIAAKVLGW